MTKLEKLIIHTKPTQKSRAIETTCRKVLLPVVSELKKPLVVAIGGDGTMLGAIKKHLEDDVIFVGVSAGTLGFLQTVEPAEIVELARALKSQSFSVLKAPLLEVSTKKGKKLARLGYGFSDISIDRAEARAVHLNLHIGGSTGNFIGDGVIFATPLGSTAYSLSGGGPIVDSEIANVFVVTPNNPHISLLYSSLQRPHIMAATRQVEIGITKANIVERPARITIDGETVVEQLDGTVVVGLSDKFVSLLTLSPDTFQNRIEQKRLGRY